MDPNSKFQVIPFELTKLYNHENTLPFVYEHEGVIYTKHTVFLPSECTLLTIRKPNPLPEGFFDNIVVMTCDNTNNLLSNLKRSYDETGLQDSKKSTSSTSKRLKTSEKCQRDKYLADSKKSSNVFIMFRTYFSKRFGKHTGKTQAGELSKIASIFWDDIKVNHQDFLLPFIAMSSLDSERRRLEKAENDSRYSKKGKEIENAKKTLETLGKYCPVPLCCRKLGKDDKNVLTYVEPKDDNDLIEQSTEHSNHQTGYIKTHHGQKRSQEIIDCLESDCIHPRIKEQLGLLNEYLRNKLGVSDKDKLPTTSLEDLSIPNSAQLASPIASTPWDGNSQMVNQTNEISSFTEQMSMNVPTIDNFLEAAASTTSNILQPKRPSTQTPATFTYPPNTDIYNFLQSQLPNTLVTSQDLSFLGSGINNINGLTAESWNAIWEHINRNGQPK